ncbi:MAG: prop effector ProQ, partial [Burkholderiales bacterium]|nr:prop effector ProQ [Burkholderiales bacterium]
MNPDPTAAPDPGADPAADAAEVAVAVPAGAAATATPPADPDACAAALRARFPALFGGAPKPLKLRIQADIQARAPGVFTKAALSAFLRRHTGRHGY